MKIKKLVTLTAMTVLTGNVWGQTDVTSQYIKNADFSADAALTVNLCGYGGDISKTANKLNGNNAVFGSQKVTEWKDNNIKTDGNSGPGGAGGIFAYGSAPQLIGNNKAAPATNPEDESTGKALGIFAVWLGTIQYTQEVTLPKGCYTLTFTYYNQSGEAGVATNLFGFETSKKKYYGSTKSFPLGYWNYESVSFELKEATTGTISVGYTSTNSGKSNCPMLFVDNVKLETITKDDLEVINKPKAKAELKSLIDKFTVTVPKTNVGYDAFQYPQDKIDIIKYALQAAQAVYDNNDATLDNVNEQIEIVEALTLPAALNSPDANTRYSIKNVSNTYKYINKAMTLIDDATKPGGYKLIYSDKQNSYYGGQAFKFTPVTGKIDTYYLSETDKDGATRYLCLGTKYNGNANQIRTTTNEKDAAEFRVIPMADEGNWKIINVEANNTLGASGQNDNGVFTANGYFRMVIAPADQAEATLKIVSGVKYGTFIAPFNADKPENVTLYSVKEVNGSTLTLVEESEIAANTPYIVYADKEVTKIFQGYGTAYNDTYEAHNLVGTLAGGDMTTLDENCYLLQNNDEGVGFYQCVAGQTYKLGANRAYLKNETSASVKAFFFGEENQTTAITTLSELMNGKAEIYDLNGRKLRKLEKGINIVNGKKVIIK